jgi:hypothetical protein
MQTFFMFRPSSLSRRSEHISDPSIEASDLGRMIAKTFSEIELPPGMSGCVKLQQRQINPDAFDLYFFSNSDVNAYDAGRCYSASDIAVFERSEFESFPHSNHRPERRVHEFVARLAAGALRPASFD